MQELMTREIAEGLPRLYEQDGAGDPTVYVHYFSCVNGWDWWLLEFDGTDEAFGLVGLLDPVGQAARVAAQLSRRLGVRRARFPVQLNGPLLEFRRVPGRWIAHGPLAFLRCGHHAEREIDLSTDLGQIQPNRCPGSA